MDVFIDDIITINIEKPCWVERTKNAALLIIHTIFKPWHSDEPLKQDDSPHSKNSQKNIRLPNERSVCVGTSRPALYGYL